MGLDMYLYKVSNLKAKEITSLTGRNTKEFPEDVWVFEAKDIEKFDNEAMFADLMPFMDKINAVMSFYDVDKMKVDNDIPNVAHVGMKRFEKDFITFGFYWGDESKDVIFNRGEYILNKDVEVYACRAKQIKYWRKAYDVQNRIHDTYDGYIENCGYYALGEEILSELLPRYKNFEGIVYHEWY